MSSRIVVLDGYTLNPGDLSWAGLQALGDCSVFDRTPEDRIIERALPAAIVLTNKTPLPRTTLAALPALRYIGVLATGTNVVDIPAATERGIVVSNIPAYGTRSVAQMTFAHILEWTQQVALHDRSVRSGAWSRSPDFCYWERPLLELAGLVLGVVGFGQIGRAVARLGEAFGMKVLITRRDDSAGKVEGFECAALEELLRRSDVISLHCPLTPQTRHLINEESLRLVRPSALIVNTGRGELVDGHALAAALEEGRLAGAGLDVLETEPPSRDDPLLRAKNCRITPHIAWATRAARSRLMRAAVQNVVDYLDGSPSNRVLR